MNTSYSSYIVGPKQKANLICFAYYFINKDKKNTRINVVKKILH